MTRSELSWLAGLLEAEGTFLSPPPSAPRTPRITLRMTDKDVVDRAAALMGVQVTRIRVQGKMTKPQYSVTAVCARAIALATAIRPVMSLRRQAAIDTMTAACTSVVFLPSEVVFPSLEGGFDTDAWLAGVLEGEASFVPGRLGRPYDVAITVGMTDEDTIAKIASIFGGKYRKQVRRDGYRKPKYIAQACCSRAVGWMERLLPWLGERRAARAQEVVRSYRERPNQGRGRRARVAA